MLGAGGTLGLTQVWLRSPFSTLTSGHIWALRVPDLGDRWAQSPQVQPSLLVKGRGAPKAKCTQTDPGLEPKHPLPPLSLLPPNAGVRPLLKVQVDIPESRFLYIICYFIHFTGKAIISVRNTNGFFRPHKGS